VPVGRPFRLTGRLLSPRQLKSVAGGPLAAVAGLELVTPIIELMAYLKLVRDSFPNQSKNKASQTLS
jgi:hypothetical protein